MTPLRLEPLPGASFGARVRPGPRHGDGFARTLAGDPAPLARALHAHGGLLLVRGLEAVSEAPKLLLQMSRGFGSEVEDYRETLTDAGNVHPTVPEIFVVSNAPPANRRPPPRPDPPLDEHGALPVRFPHRRGWHTDQSYRRPPPDVSLFYCVHPAPPGQGQTLYADGTAAYARLPARLKRSVEGLHGLHVRPGRGRAEALIRSGQVPPPLAAHEQPQRQPVVRVHPVTGRPALYLCEAGQMDWLEGPFEGMERGPDGAGAALLYELMSHYTRPEFVYVHEWRAGDLIVYDNRCLVHAATWFDADTCRRVMWRTTVAGNPGAGYAGERKSWLPRAS